MCLTKAVIVLYQAKGTLQLFFVVGLDITQVNKQAATMGRMFRPHFVLNHHVIQVHCTSL